MADDLTRLINKYKNLKPATEKIVNKIMLSNSEILENEVRGQLSKGKDGEGQTIQRGYSRQYGRRRASRGLQTSFVDLNFSGDFYKSIVMVPFIGILEYVFISEVEYARYLEGKYENILEISQINMVRFTKNILNPELNIGLTAFLR